MPRPTKPAAQPASQKPRGSRFLRALGWLDFWLMCSIWAILRAIGETWWVGAALTYAPLSALCLSAALLGLLSLPWDRKAVLLHLVAMGVVAGPVMGFVVPLQQLLDRDKPWTGPRLRIVSCNVQSFPEDFEQRLKEVVDLQPDLLLLQEASRPAPELDQAFADWHFVAAGNLKIGSRFPVRLLSEIHLDEFDRRAALVAEVAVPGGPVHVVNVHQMTPRPGLANPTPGRIRSGEWGRQVGEWEEKRRREMRSLRRAVDRATEGKPRIIAGDFNAPCTSPVFRRYWGDLRNAFTQTGWGWGYTAPCADTGPWPANTPWIRIDHVLCSSEWRILDGRTGTSRGSDHRLVLADLGLTGAAQEVEDRPASSPAPQADLPAADDRRSGAPAE